ncbi:MAG: TerB family tellurite resistance protein [Byssovorax sp.]
MELLIPPPDAIPFGLRALKAIAVADGRFDASERDLLRTMLRLFGADHDLDALPPIEPDELAREIRDPALRRQLVRGMIILSIIDGEASPAEAALVERYAAALGVGGSDLTALRHLAEGRLLVARFDIARRFFAREKMVEMAKQKGLRWLGRTLAVMAGVAEDAGMAAPYRALGDAPEGSLGRAYHDFVVRNQFSFPGEKGAPPEAVVFHDLTHVLSGYDTDPAGEMLVLAFHAGCRREENDPFSFLLFGIAEFHLGLGMSPVASSTKGMFDPPKVLRALARGRGCAIDPTKGWDPWPVMHRPLDELRREYGIAPLDAD